MRLLLLLTHLLPVLSQAPPSPPQDVQVDQGWLSWSPAPGDEDVHFTVRYHSFRSPFDEESWDVVPACQQTLSRSCNVSLTGAQAGHGCVKLQVEALRGGQTSRPGQACSVHGEPAALRHRLIGFQGTFREEDSPCSHASWTQSVPGLSLSWRTSVPPPPAGAGPGADWTAGFLTAGDSCSPEVRLTARPGSLTVHLTDDHSLFLNYAAHATHRIYFGKEGEPLQKHTQSASSWTIGGLEAGQSYCAKVEYVIFNKSVGLSSCVQCVLVPGPDSAHSEAVAAVVVLVLLLVLVVPVTAYILIFHRGKIKEHLRPPYQIPPDILELDQQHGVLLPLYSPSEEHCDLLSSVTPADAAQQ